MKDRKIKIVDGRERFEGNGIIRFLFIVSGVGIDSIATLYESGLVKEEEIREFYQLLGYSVNGYHEIFPDDETRKKENPDLGTLHCGRCSSEVEQTGYYEYYCEHCEMYMTDGDLMARGKRE